MLPPEIIVTIEQISPKESRYLARTRRSDGTEICRNTFQFAPGLLIDVEPQWMLEKAVPRDPGEWVKRGPFDARGATEEQKLATYGQRLYGFLFGDGNDFEAFLRYDDKYRQQARLTLAMHSNAATLWRLPWEYLHHGTEFLALSGRFLVNRRPDGLANLEFPAISPPLRLLIVISAPDDAGPLDTEEEIGVIQTALDEALRLGRVVVEYLDDATLPAIGEALRRFRPHVLHYTGHGGYDAAQGRSFLALENEDGKTRPADISALRPHLRNAPDLRLVVLSGCQTAQTNAVDAFSGVATGLLRADIPAVLAMQFSILDQSGIKLARVFYDALAQGDTPGQALQHARVALWQFDAGPGYDWGVPALYLRAQGLRLIDPSVMVTPVASPQRAALIDVGGLPLPPHFVGRTRELRELRRALRDNRVNAAFVRGIGGIGKSSVAAKLMQRPGTEVDAELVIRCHEVDPLDIPSKLARFLEARGAAGHAEAASVLLDSSQPPASRARHAAALVRDRRYLFVFDNFESVMTISAPGSNPPSQGADREASFAVMNPDLAGLFRGLLEANWHSLCLFSGRYRWDALGEFLGRATAVEIHLPALSLRQAIMLMDNLPRLHQLDLETKIALYQKVGGHPKSIELLEGWLASGRVSDLLADPNLESKLAREWEAYFLRALLAQLPPLEEKALARLSIFRGRLGEQVFHYAGVNAATIRRWLDLSLIHRESKAHQAQPAYSIHPVVSQYLLAPLSPDERRELHAWAATYYSRPFIEIARRAATTAGKSVPVEEIEKLAAGEVVSQMVRQTDNLDLAQGTMSGALEWRHHLVATGDYTLAGEIVSAVWPVLDRWGQRDRAKALLRRSIDTLSGPQRDLAEANLATLLKQQGGPGKPYQTEGDRIRGKALEAVGAMEGRSQQALLLSMMAETNRRLGKYDYAINYEKSVLEKEKNQANVAGQAISLYQLASDHYLTRKYFTALDYSQAAEESAREAKREPLLARILHQQGALLNRLADLAQTGQEREGGYRAAVDRLQDSLRIYQRIGDEVGTCDALGELGKALQGLGRMPEAITTLLLALEIAQRLERPTQVGFALEQLGLVHEEQGLLEAALEKYEQARVLFQQHAPQDTPTIEQHIDRVRQRIRAQ